VSKREHELSFSTHPLTLFSSQSDLFPTRILDTPSLACCSMLECQVRMSKKALVSTNEAHQQRRLSGKLTAETLLIGHIVDKQDTHGTSVVCSSNCSEPLLSSSIPLHRKPLVSTGHTMYAWFLCPLTICNLILLPSSSIVRILKSIPIVVMNDGVHASSQNRSKRHDFPTPTKIGKRKEMDEQGKIKLRTGSVHSTYRNLQSAEV